MWVEKYENGTSFYGILLILFSIFLLAANIFLLILNINEFWDNNSFNKFSIIFAIIMIILFVILVLMKFNENSSILTALFIGFLYNYLSGIAMSSIDDEDPNKKENNYRKILYGFLFHFFINLILGFITVGFASLSEESSENFKKINLNI